MKQLSSISFSLASILTLLVFLTFSQAAFARETAKKTLLIAAASDLKFALDDLLTGFRTDHPEYDVKPTYGSSGKFFSQIDNGAPFDVFLSADVRFATQLIDKGRAEKNSVFLYAVGHIVVWVPKDSKINVEQLGIQALLDPGIHKIAIANPKVAPYGRAAVAALKKLGVYDAVSPKLVLGENISQTAQFIQTGAADIGIIALSLALAPTMKDQGRYWSVPPDAFPRMEQAGVILSKAKNPEGATALKEYLSTAKAQAVLKAYGFDLPEPAPAK